MLQTLLRRQALLYSSHASRFLTWLEREHLQQQVLHQHRLLQRHARLVQAVCDLVRRESLPVLQRSLRLSAAPHSHVLVQELSRPPAAAREGRRVTRQTVS